MNLPNALTVARIFLVPFLVVVLLTRFEAQLIFGLPKEVVGAAIFGLAAFTDWLDGYLARRRRQITTLGQIMDPLADKLLTTANAGDNADTALFAKLGVVPMQAEGKVELEAAE